MAAFRIMPSVWPPELSLTSSALTLKNSPGMFVDVVFLFTDLYYDDIPLGIARSPWDCSYNSWWYQPEVLLNKGTGWWSSSLNSYDVVARLSDHDNSQRNTNVLNI